MLCMRSVFLSSFLEWRNDGGSNSGFERDDVWGYRSLEPDRCCIASIALVLLKTGIVHPPLLPSDTPSATTTDGTGTVTMLSNGAKPAVQVNAQQLATAQKLLLFWRKPAVSPFVLPS